MNSKLSNRKTSTLLALVVMFFWGSLFPMIKIGYRVFDINTASVGSILLFAGIRFVICGILMTGFASVRERKLCVPDRNTLPAILLVALFAYALHYTCTYIGLSHMESSKAALIKQLGTLFVVCFAFLFRKEDRFTFVKLLCGLLGFASIIVVNLKGLRFDFQLWDLLLIGAAVCSVLSTVLCKNAYDPAAHAAREASLNPLTVTAWAQLLGGIGLLAVGMVMGGRIGRFDFSSLLTLCYICLASCIGYTLWNVLLKYNDMSRLNIIKFSEPIFSALCSWVLLGENIWRIPYIAAFILQGIGMLIVSGVIRLPKKGDMK